MKDKHIKLLRLFTIDRIAFRLAIARIPAHAFDCSTLLEFLRPDASSEFDLDAARIILLRHFPSSLDCETLFDFCISQEEFVCNQAFDLLNAFSAGDLPYKMLLGILEKDIYEQSSVLLFLNKIPPHHLDYKDLISYLRSDSSDVRECVRFLLDKIPAGRFDFQTLLSLVGDNHLAVSEYAGALLMKHFRYQIEQEVLNSLLEFSNGDFHDLALEIISERFTCDTKTSDSVEGIVGLFS